MRSLDTLMHNQFYWLEWWESWMAARHLAKWFINREMLFNMRISVVQNKTVPPSDGAQLVDEEQEENSQNKERILLSPAALPRAAPWRRIIPESTSLPRLAVGQFNRRPHETGDMKGKWNDKKSPKPCGMMRADVRTFVLFLFFLSFIRVVSGIYKGGDPPVIWTQQKCSAVINYICVTATMKSAVCSAFSRRAADFPSLL